MRKTAPLSAKETSETEEPRSDFAELTFRPVNLPGATNIVGIVFPLLNQSEISSVDESAVLLLIQKRIAYIMGKPLNFDPTKPFPGAYAMGLSLKEAVETYLLARFGEGVVNLNKADFAVTDPKLHVALKNYKRDFGILPFNMETKHTLARKRFEHVAAVGWENAPKAERRAANEAAKRRHSKPGNG